LPHGSSGKSGLRWPKPQREKDRLAVVRDKGCAIPTAQAESAGIAARRLAPLAYRWCGRSVVSAQRSAAVALCQLACPSSLTSLMSLMSLIPCFSTIFSRRNHSGRVWQVVCKKPFGSARGLPNIEPSGHGISQVINRTTRRDVKGRGHGH